MSQVVVRCRKCGTTRPSYNDPRAHPGTVIECAAKCYESHPLWDFVSECESALAAGRVPAVAASHGEETSKKRSRNEDHGHHHDSKDVDRPAVRRAFAEEDEAAPNTQAKEESSCPCKIS